MRSDSVAGLSLPDNEVHTASAPEVAASSSDLTGSGRMECCRSCVDAADAKKAEGASIFALLIPSPPCLTGRDA